MSTPELFLTTVTLGLIYLRFAFCGWRAVCLFPTDRDPGMCSIHTRLTLAGGIPGTSFWDSGGSQSMMCCPLAGPCHSSHEPPGSCTRHTGAAEGHVLTPVSCHILPPQLCFPVSLCLLWLRSVYPLMKWLSSCPGLRAATGEWKSLIEWRTL